MDGVPKAFSVSSDPTKAGVESSPKRRDPDTEVEDQGETLIGMPRKRLKQNTEGETNPADSLSLASHSKLCPGQAQNTEPLNFPKQYQTPPLKNVVPSRPAQTTSTDDHARNQPTVSELQNRLDVANLKNARLEEDLLEQYKWNAKVETRIKQDMFLHIMHEQQLRKKAEGDLAREKWSFSRHVAELTQKSQAEREQTIAVTKERDKCAQEINSWRRQCESLQCNIEELDEDLRELRRIENEAAASRRDEHLGLPPAYGSLNDEDRFPPYSRHEDGGTLEVAHLKREVRQRFDKVVDSVFGASDLVVFTSLTDALAEACHSCQALLQLATEASVGHALGLPHGHTEDLSYYWWRKDRYLSQRVSSAPYFAERVCKLILELLWRFLGIWKLQAFETVFFHTDAHLRMSFDLADLVLFCAVQRMFSYHRSLAKLAYYSDQLKSVKDQFAGLMLSFEHNYFCKTVAWLEEQVEKERELRANANVRVPMYAEEGSDISSRFHDSDANEDSEG